MFFLRHKILSLFIVAVGLYIYFNPGDGFGVARRALVIYKRMPIAFMDFFVDPDGKVSLVGNLSETGVFGWWWSKSNIAVPSSASSYTPFHLVVGTGFGRSPSFVFPDSCAQQLKERGIKVEMASTPRAAELYNTYRRQAKRVAALMSVR